MGTVTEVEAALREDIVSNSYIFSGSIDILSNNSAYVFKLVNAETLTYILNQAKLYGEVSVEIFKYDDVTEAIQQQDRARYNI